MKEQQFINFSFGLVDEFGNPVQRTKHTHPYSYDGFIVWRAGPNEEVNNTIYSDQLLQCDWDKHNKLCQKHFGNNAQMWYDRDPEKIEEFLRDWFDNPNLKLIFIMEYCNVSNGYPVWRFDIKTKEK